MIVFPIFMTRLGSDLLQVLFGSGDVLAQQVVDRKGLEKHDFARTGRMALYGGGKPFPTSW